MWVHEEYEINDRQLNERFYSSACRDECKSKRKSKAKEISPAYLSK
jgi:hypothetical protein